MEHDVERDAPSRDSGVHRSTHVSEGEDATFELARSFGGTLVPGDVVALMGELGAGKTVFARGVAHALGIKDGITSPTFTLIHEYEGDIPLYHMDLYRMEGIEEIRDIGIEDYFSGDGVCLVEWAEKLDGLLPEDAYRVTLRYLGATKREITIERPETR